MKSHKKTGPTVHLQAYYPQQYPPQPGPPTTHTVHILAPPTQRLSSPQYTNSSNPVTTPPEPPQLTSATLSFHFFFKLKLTPSDHHSCTLHLPTCPPHLPLSPFCPVSPAELSESGVGMRSSTCVLDSIPFKDCFPASSSLITKTMNSSMSSGSVPQTLKLAAVTPILKKPRLDPDIVSNCRPISNLPFSQKYWSVSSPPNSKATLPPMPCFNHFNLVSTHSIAQNQPSSTSPMTSSSPETLVSSAVSSSSTSLQLLTPSITPAFSPSLNPPSTSLALPSPH